MKNKYLKIAEISEVTFPTSVDSYSEDLVATQAARLGRVNRNTAQLIYSLLRARIVSLAISGNTPSVEKSRLMKVIVEQLEFEANEGEELEVKIQ